MNLKIAENQLSVDLKFRVIFSIFIWLCLMGAVAWRLISLFASGGSGFVAAVTVPSLNRDNISILSSSIKTPVPDSGQLSITRAEPFD